MGLINIFTLLIRPGFKLPKLKNYKFLPLEKYNFDFDCEQEKYNIYLNFKKETEILYNLHRFCSNSRKKYRSLLKKLIFFKIFYNKMQ